MSGPSVMKGYHNNIAATNEVSLSFNFEYYDSIHFCFTLASVMTLSWNTATINQVMMNYEGARYFRTGDLGKFQNESGQKDLYITGRIKEQFKLENGKYVVPGPLEVAMMQSNYITQVRQHNSAIGSGGVVAESSTDHLRLFCRYSYTVTINLFVSV